MAILSATKSISPYQFAVFRIGFGVYLCIHFVHLLPYGNELFGHTGIIDDPSLNPLHGIFPNPLVKFGTSTFVTLYLGVAIFLSLLLALGIFRRTTCLLLWFIWASLFNRNNLISNPGIPYVGLILILSALLPPGDRLSIKLQARQKSTNNDPPWVYPAFVYWTAWGLLAVGYTFSGLVKLESPSWINGEAIRLLLDNPLARPGAVRDVSLNLPIIVLKAMTWGALVLEIAFLPLSCHRITRFYVWLLVIGMHVGIVSLVDFADLTFGMLMIHWFTLDPNWFPRPRMLVGKKNIVFFDGVCVMCNGAVKFLIGEDRTKMLYYAPLQSKTFGQINDHTRQQNLSTMVFVEAFGEANSRIYTRSTAVIRILYCLGGFWKLVGLTLRIIPRRVRDWAYGVIADHRYQWFGQRDSICTVPNRSERKQFLE